MQIAGAFILQMPRMRGSKKEEGNYAVVRISISRMCVILCHSGLVNRSASGAQKSRSVRALREPLAVACSSTNRPSGIDERIAAATLINL